MDDPLHLVGSRVQQKPREDLGLLSLAVDICDIFQLLVDLPNGELPGCCSAFCLPAIVTKEILHTSHPDLVSHVLWHQQEDLHNQLVNLFLLIFGGL